jgi:hypothetical protein
VGVAGPAGESERGEIALLKHEGFFERLETFRAAEANGDLDVPVVEEL